MRFRWYEYAIYPLTFIGLALALVLVATGALLATILNAMTKPFGSIKNALLALLTVTLLGGGVFWHYYTAKVPLDGRTVSVTITQDMSFAQLTDSLVSLGIINQSTFVRVLVFKISARVSGIDKRLWVGRYDFSGDVSMRSVLNKLETGKVALIAVTIPEGLRVEQTAGILSRAYGFDSTRIVRQAFDTLFCRERYNLPNLEGYLLPETYHFPVGVSSLEVFDKLVHETRQVVAQALEGVDSIALDENEIIILASIIEAETQIQAEQGLVSAVYRNRLKKRMLLQADPTVRYGLHLYSRKLYFKDLKRDTPYNTYMRPGLPPGAINSPGKAAIFAAVHPAESSFLYFVADGSGGHVFTKTLREHNQAKQKLKSEGKR